MEELLKLRRNCDALAASRIKSNSSNVVFSNSFTTDTARSRFPCFQYFSINVAANFKTAIS
ncbi:MAG: hypothetical protein A3C44_02310 [Gammaproteobacteria bacterium RIFCSPHIGHO2_02_FULL_39_13]|nr:MAG: hypothetical protein A3C44_02310 [Gammaproteobacteria bacterium RIFCSPHIGHO2_02_FULL_39_13]OGT48368.1 MAG: hypothetical protein A3E53_06005 [Gammaproteobacteria bacterium RIFCSPHIGHO2_12_FULL_39_24]